MSPTTEHPSFARPHSAHHQTSPDRTTYYSHRTRTCGGGAQKVGDVRLKIGGCAPIAATTHSKVKAYRRGNEPSTTGGSACGASDVQGHQGRLNGHGARKLRNHGRTTIVVVGGHGASGDVAHEDVEDLAHLHIRRAWRLRGRRRQRLTGRARPTRAEGAVGGDGVARGGGESAPW